MLLKDELIEKINELDLIIVSHGGVGSNCIADHLEKHGIKIRGKNGRKDDLYIHTCHIAVKPEKIKIPILYIYGDIVNSMNSQDRRKLLKVNIEKLSKNHKNKDDNDPFNYLFQYENFKDCVKLKYPFKKDEIKECFEKLNLNIPLPEIKERTVHYQRPYTKIVQQGVNCYENSILS